jgi:hypothetical protein
MVGRSLSEHRPLIRVLAATVFVGVFATATAVRAQPSTGAPAPEPAFECGDGGADRDVCAADTSSGVVLVHQKAEGSCTLERTWGYDARGVWVSGGCRATFAVSDTRRSPLHGATLHARRCGW